MSKYVTVKAEFVLPLSAGPVDLNSAADEVVGRLYGEFGEEGARDIRVHLQPMPPEYDRMMSESDNAKRAIEADADHGINLTSDVLGAPGTVRHPYADGVWIFPEGHPLANAERRAAFNGDTEILNELHAAAPRLKELPRGSE